MNEKIARTVIEAAWECGVSDFVVCPGGRNFSFIDILRNEQKAATYYWPEERSAAFFALGLSRKKNRPVAVIVTSGSAAAELLPAAMEAYYSSVPLLLITADRPHRFRGSGAPQTAEQVGLFGHYAKFCLDITKEAVCDLSQWTQQSPAHLNVCQEEPQGQGVYSGVPLNLEAAVLRQKRFDQEFSAAVVNRFLLQIQHPLVIVSTLPFEAKEAVLKFLLQLNAPVYLEGVAGLREDPRLQHIRIQIPEKILECAKQASYPIDGVLRIGGVPTNRIWRDIENLNHAIQVCSISELPFSGLSWNRNVAHVDIAAFLQQFGSPKQFYHDSASNWLQQDKKLAQELETLFEEEPLAEPSLIRALSLAVPKTSHVYLGNSLPIRQWDLAASSQGEWMITASRGINGIDGQLSTFLGLCQLKRDNLAILGDLTTLYDMAGFWGLSFVKDFNVSVAVVNNSGGKIFENLFPHQEMLNSHSLSFKPLAEMWGLSYQRLEQGVPPLERGLKQLIEMIPDDMATKRFWKKWDLIVKERNKAYEAHCAARISGNVI